MFELARGLKRLFKPTSAFAPPRDGIAAGDPGLAELLDLAMLRAETKACDIAAGRIGAKDRPMLQLRQARMWRELARRTGDAAALHKAAMAADAAIGALDRRNRPDAWARVRLEQAACVLTAVELGADQGLCAAAGQSLTDVIAAAPRSPEAAEAQVLRTQILAVEALLRGEPEAALAACAETGAAIATLERAPHDRALRRRAALALLQRAEMVAACGVALHDEQVLEMALADAVRATLTLDPAYEPLSWARASVLRGEILTSIGETTGDAAPLERAVHGLASMFEHLNRDHSAIDWAVGQFRLGCALVALSEAVAKPDLLEQARSAFDRAVVVLKTIPSHPLRAAAAQLRGAALCRQAEMLGDLLALDGAEAAFRCELAASDPESDPVAWAICQMNLAQTYLVRVALTRTDNGQRIKAAMALDAAMDVFAEHGLKGLTDAAASHLQRVRAKA